MFGDRIVNADTGEEYKVTAGTSYGYTYSVDEITGFVTSSWTKDGKVVRTTIHGPDSYELAFREGDHFAAELRTPNSDWVFDVREGGCVHIWQFDNGHTPETDPGRENASHMHVCEVDDLIHMLEQVREFQGTHNWPTRESLD